MLPALTLLNTATTAVANAEIDRILSSELGVCILEVQKSLDRLRVVQAHLLTAADQHLIWADSGHKDMAAWLAANGKTSLGTAKRQIKLGNTLSKSAALADAVAAGEITPETAEALQPALASQHSGDEKDLIDACKGANPFDAQQAGTIFQEMNRPAGQTDAYTKGTVTGGREQPTVVVVIDIDVLERRKPGAGYTNTGDIIPAEIVRNMCTNANIQRLLTSGSIPLDLGRTQRLATDAQYKAILARDGGCGHHHQKSRIGFPHGSSHAHHRRLPRHWCRNRQSRFGGRLPCRHNLRVQCHGG